MPDQTPAQSTCQIACQIAASFRVPPAMLGPEPPMETIRERADYYTAMARTMGADPLVLSEHDRYAQGEILRDKLRQMGVL